MKKYFLLGGIFVVALAVFSVFVFSRVSERADVKERSSDAPSSGSASQKIAVYSDEKTSDKKPITILFAGDMMFDRYIRTQSDTIGKSALFEGVSKQLSAEDLVVANLEGPITSNTSKSVGSISGESRNYIFTFDPVWARVLFDEHIRVVNIGNNHILNFGAAGLAETRNFLREANVKFFGDPLDESLRAYVVDAKGKRIGFVNYNQFSMDAETHAIADIARLRSLVDILFVYTHWGTEYIPATSEEKRLAHLFIDRGVDAVIGSHPHVVQEHELYKGKAIYYSLGNFVFDQYFSAETKHGLMVEAAIASDNTISFRDIPVELSPDGRTKVSSRK